MTYFLLDGIVHIADERQTRCDRIRRYGSKDWMDWFDSHVVVDTEPTCLWCLGGMPWS